MRRCATAQLARDPATVRACEQRFETLMNLALKYTIKLGQSRKDLQDWFERARQQVMAQNVARQADNDDGREASDAQAKMQARVQAKAAAYRRQTAAEASVEREALAVELRKNVAAAEAAAAQRRSELQDAEESFKTALTKATVALSRPESAYARLGVMSMTILCEFF